MSELVYPSPAKPASVQGSIHSSPFEVAQSLVKSHEMRYRPDIDGLRAIAVLSVVFFHINKTWLPGGFIGVDVFFVISGYLITFLIYGEVQSGQFSFKNFYRRRINRIFPALFVVIFVNFVAGMVILAPMDFIRTAKSAIYALLGFSNFFFWKEYGNYFSSGVDEAPLLNTWSLAVEEQFYLFWPILLFLLVKLPRKYLFAGSVIGLILAVGVSEYGVRNASSASYYLLPTRFFELLVGGALSIWIYRRGVPWGDLGSTIAGVTGLAMIIGGFFLLDDASSFPGLNALYPCIGAALIISSGCHSNSKVGRMLSFKPMVFFGLISYSLYLWHWPIIAYVHYIGVHIGIVESCAIFTVSTLLAWCTWKFVEIPFRTSRGSISFSGVLFKRYVLPGATVILVSYSIIHTNGVRMRFPPEVSEFEHIIASAPNILRQQCHSSSLFYETKPNALCVLGDKSKELDGILIGDSYANHFTGMIDVLATHERVSIMDYTLDGCLPIKGVKLGAQASYAEKCKLRNDFNYQLIQEKQYRYVVLAGAWPTTGTPEVLSDIRNGLAKSVEAIVAAGSKPIIILSNPRIEDAEKCPLRSLLFNRSTSCNTQQKPDAGDFNIFANIRSRFPEAIFVDPTSAICKDKICTPQIGKVPMYRDNGHLNDVGSRLIGQILLDRGVQMFSR